MKVFIVTDGDYRPIHVFSTLEDARRCKHLLEEDSKDVYCIDEHTVDDVKFLDDGKRIYEAECFPLRGVTVVTPDDGDAFLNATWMPPEKVIMDKTPWPDFEERAVTFFRARNDEEARGVAEMRFEYRRLFMEEGKE